jgi:ribonuclease HII
MLAHEQQAWDAGHHIVAGVDEAGRGPLAGPVVAAAVLMDRGFLERERDGSLAGLTDSKKLTPSKRKTFRDFFVECNSIEFGIGLSTVEEIDRINILRATHAAMGRALHELPRKPDFALIDGLPVPGLPTDSRSIVKGDGKSLSIAAASVVAKVWRDEWMIALDGEHPQYGFARNKGYGTREHIAALRLHGPCPQHRRSFAPVAQLRLDLECGS